MNLDSSEIEQNQLKWCTQAVNFVVQSFESVVQAHQTDKIGQQILGHSKHVSLA